MPSNDNDSAASMARPIDPHGQAALILVESLIHGLISRSVLTLTDVLDIVNAAIEVQADYAADVGPATAAMQRSHTLLSMIAMSLERDLSGKADASDTSYAGSMPPLLDPC